MHSNKKPSLLIVDDVLDMCTSLQDIFVDLGYKTDIATNRLDAKKLLEEHPYDIALIDMLLEKQEGGIEVVKHLKQKGLKTSAFVMTAYQQEALLREASDNGVFRIFMKPFDIEELIEAFEKEIEKRNSKAL